MTYTKTTTQSASALLISAIHNRSLAKPTMQSWHPTEAVSWNREESQAIRNLWGVGKVVSAKTSQLNGFLLKTNITLNIENWEFDCQQSWMPKRKQISEIPHSKVDESFL